MVNASKVGSRFTRPGDCRWSLTQTESKPSALDAQRRVADLASHVEPYCGTRTPIAGAVGAMAPGPYPGPSTRTTSAPSGAASASGPEAGSCWTAPDLEVARDALGGGALPGAEVDDRRARSRWARCPAVTPV